MHKVKAVEVLEHYRLKITLEGDECRVFDQMGEGNHAW
jgi:hypothetical protein